MAVFKSDLTEEDTDTLVRERVEPPKLYKVLMHNDDATPMEFVVDILKSVFRKNDAEAVHLTMHIHSKGVGLCGIYTREIAEAKVVLVMRRAQQQRHPLTCTMEEE